LCEVVVVVVAVVVVVCYRVGRVFDVALVGGLGGAVM
jgi:hypothetical protein